MVSQAKFDFLFLLARYPIFANRRTPFRRIAIRLFAGMEKNMRTPLIAAQVKLLRAERKISEIAANFNAKTAASAGALTALFVGAGAQAADALGDAAPANYGAELAAKANEVAASGSAQALADLAAMTAKYHAAVETMAAEAGMRLLAHGQPKDAFLRGVMQSLGLG